MNKLDTSKEHMKTLGSMSRFCMVLARAAHSIFLPNSNSKLKILCDSNSKIFKASSSSFSFVQYHYN